MTPAEMIDKYVQIRDHKKKASEEFDATMKPVNEALQKLEAMILDKLNTDNIESIKTEFGTAYRSVSTSATVKDRDAFLDFVLSKRQLEALDVRANKTFVKEWMDANGPIPGIEMTSFAKVGVRRS